MLRELTEMGTPSRNLTFRNTGNGACTHLPKNVTTQDLLYGFETFGLDLRTSGLSLNEYLKTQKKEVIHE